MSEQLRRRRQLAKLVTRQIERRASVERQKQMLDELLEKKDREISNLRASLTIGIAG